MFRAQGIARGAGLLLRGLLFLRLCLQCRQMLSRFRGGSGDGVFLIEQLLRFIGQERDARAALGQCVTLLALFGKQLRIRALGRTGGRRIAVDLV